MSSRQETTTFCRICEALCGLVATVEDGELIQLRPSPGHPLSEGFACPKGIAMTEIVNDPDRVLYPLRRRADVPPGPVGPEAFERITWDQALKEIGARLARLIDQHGGSSVGLFSGAATFFDSSLAPVILRFISALGSPHRYSSASQDVSARYTASNLLYGSPTVVPIPDLYRTDFLLVIGANPLISHGSLFHSKRIRETLNGIVGRGGRIVVVDPRRTETAAAYEHLPVRPGADAWMLLSILDVIFAEGLEDRESIARQARGADSLRELAALHPPEETAERTGIAPDRLRQLARDLAGAPGAAVYGRCGVNRGRSATLVSFLIEALNLVTGNLDRPGGSIIGTSPIAGMPGGAHGTRRTRIGGFPDIVGNMPAGVMAKEMLTPGEGQLRGLLTIAGNPILSVPNGAELARGLTGLDLHVAVDLYLSDTAQYADYVLPAASFLERSDIKPLSTQAWHLTPHLEWSEPVLPPRGEARQDADILEDIARSAGVMLESSPLLRTLARAGVRISYERRLDKMLRLGPYGDRYGLRRSGISLKKLRARRHGIVLAEHQPTGVLQEKIRHPDMRAHLDPPEIAVEVRELEQRHAPDPDFPLSLIGMRELRSINSWMKNSAKLMAADRTHAARIHPDDAAAAGISDGAVVRVSSKTSTIELPARLTNDMVRGAIAIPHGWGHHKGYGTIAGESGGANVNLLASTDIDDIERVSGTSHLDGIPVRIERAEGSTGSPPA